MRKVVQAGSTGIRAGVAERTEGSLIWLHGIQSRWVRAFEGRLGPGCWPLRSEWREL